MSGFKGLSTKMLIGVAGLVASLFIIFIVISAVLNRGTDAKLTTFDESKISFVVDVPEGWNVLGNNYSGADVLVAKPPELAETDSRTILNVTRNTNAKPGSVEDFRKKTQETIQLLNNSEYQSSQNIRVSDVSTATFGTDAAPGYKASFTLRDISSGETYKSFAYFIYESKDTATNITLVLDSTNEKYAEVADTIVSSYRKR